MDAAAPGSAYAPACDGNGYGRIAQRPFRREDTIRASVRGALATVSTRCAVRSMT